MATTSFVYHTLGLHGYRLIRTEYVDGCVYFHVERVRQKRKCRGCRARWNHLRLNGRFQREFIALPVGRRRVFIVLHGHYQKCSCCGRTLREPVPFACGMKRYVKAFERLVVDLCRIATIKHVADFLGVGWDLVKEIFKNHLRKRDKRRRFAQVRYLAIDEFAVRKGHRYMTLVMDLKSGHVLHVGDGKGGDAVVPFLRSLKRRGATIEAVAIDMWPAFIRAVTDALPGVDIVHDPFHVVALANKALDDTRKELYRRLKGADSKVIKGTRFLLLKGGEKLDQPAIHHLSKLASMNEPLIRAYLLKEELRYFWSLTERKARRFLNAWIRRAQNCGLRHFEKLADVLLRHKPQILTYFKHRITTGPIEGLNNKVKVLKRQAYGFRDIEYFKLRLLFIHEEIPRFPG
jgi:transposase